MRSFTWTVLIVAGFVAAAVAANPHVITFGKPLPVKLFVGPDEQKSIDMKIRSLYVDGKLKEFTTGETHDITDRLFVVRRAFRLNDWLPQDEGTNHKWKWQRGGWLMVDRDSGRISRRVVLKGAGSLAAVLGAPGGIRANQECPPARRSTRWRPGRTHHAWGVA